MRISDWSSDVCSSDLDDAETTAEDRLQERRGLRRKHGHDGAERQTGSHIIGDPQHVGAERLIDHTPVDRCGAVAIARLIERRRHGLPPQAMVCEWYIGSP